MDNSLEVNIKEILQTLKEAVDYLNIANVRQNEVLLNDMKDAVTLIANKTKYDFGSREFLHLIELAGSDSESVISLKEAFKKWSSSVTAVTEDFVRPEERPRTFVREDSCTKDNELNINYINTDKCRKPVPDGNLYENRSALASGWITTGAAEVTLLLPALNRLEKTKCCVESILENTVGIDYELLLIDSGSTDGTMEYFEAVPWPKKRIIRVSKAVGVMYLYSCLNVSSVGRYLVLLTNDLILTPNWLNNLIRCAKSDDRIGMVTPVSSNVSNAQEVTLPFKNYSQMMDAARKYNVSDPHKWEERLRLITLGSLIKKEVLLAIGMPLQDNGFYHDFGDDDLTFRVRRAGYRAILAGDTWVHHNHDFRNNEGKNPESFQRSLQYGKKNFLDKYGVDAWDDVNNFYFDILNQLTPDKTAVPPAILGIDTRCGTPILDIKNWLVKNGIFLSRSSAFTQKTRYITDLHTICGKNVFCGREEFLITEFERQSFDYIIIDRPLNKYGNPEKLVENIFMLCKDNGTILLCLDNTFSFQEYFYMLGLCSTQWNDISWNMTFEACRTLLEKHGKILYIAERMLPLNESDKKNILSSIPQNASAMDREQCCHRLEVRQYVFVIRK